MARMPPPRFLPRPFRVLLRRSPAEPPQPVPDEVSRALAERLDAAAQARLGRSLSVFAVEAAGCGGCALEVAALAGPHYDLERFGLRFVASPLHADVLLVAGALGRNMAEALERALACTPEPRWVVAMGDCAADGGPFRGSYAVAGGVAEAVPVDLVIPGCPPTPAQVLEGLLALMAAQRPGKASGKKKGRSEGSAGPWLP